MRITRRKPLTARVGVVAVGHRTYWSQFDGLLDELMGKVDVLTSRIAEHGIDVETFGMVDTSEAAYDILPKIQSVDLDLLIIDMVTYAPSSTFGVLCRSLDIPIVMAVLQPLKDMNYAKASTYVQLCNDDFCAVPEFAGVALRMGKRIPPIILGSLYDDPQADAELADWCQIAKVLHDLKRARLGLMGHALEAMLDMHTDPTAVTRTFGCHVVMCEPNEIMDRYELSRPQELVRKRQEILDFFETPDPVSDPLTSKLTDDDLELATRVTLALEAFINAKNLDGLAYYYEGAEGSVIRCLMTNLIVGNSLLTGAGFPMCGEFDIKTCIAMLIMDRLDMGGSFAEFHPIDFVRDTILVGHDGPHHVNIADGRPILRSLSRYHGKPGSGASVEFKLKVGPITMLSIGMKPDGSFKFVLAEGESVHGPVPPTGNTNTHGKFKPDIRTFLRRWIAEGPTHHFALGIGHRAKTIKAIADCLGIEAVIVTV